MPNPSFHWEVNVEEMFHSSMCMCLKVMYRHQIATKRVVFIDVTWTLAENYVVACTRFKGKQRNDCISTYNMHPGVAYFVSFLCVPVYEHVFS